MSGAGHRPGPGPGPAVGYGVAGGVATVRLDRPANRNVLSLELVNDLGDALTRAVGDPAARVIVLTNSGPAFCAGADLKRSASPAATPPAARWSLPQILSLMMDSPKPVVGRIAGHAMGGGVGLAAACDLSVASSEALFGFTEVRRGVAPAIISVVCLPKLRRADALELFLTGRRITAARAAEVGLVTTAVPPERLDAAVASLVGELSAGGPKALAAAKRLVARVPSMPRDEAFAWTTELSAALFASEEATQAMAAFRDKVDPPWVPRPAPGEAGAPGAEAG